MKAGDRKIQAKEERIAKNLEKDTPSLMEALKALLKDKHGVSLEEFSPSCKTALPSWALIKDGTTIGFADVVIGPRDDYVKVKASTYRNGAFVTEHFGIAKSDGSKETIRMRYVVFLVDWERIYKWAYNPATAKRRVTLMEGVELFVFIPKKEWELL